MTVPVHLWSYFRDLAGTAQLDVDVPVAASVEDVLRAVYALHPKLGGLRNSTLIAVGVDDIAEIVASKAGSRVDVVPGLKNLGIAGQHLADCGRRQIG